MLLICLSPPPPIRRPLSTGGEVKMDFYCTQGEKGKKRRMQFSQKPKSGNINSQQPDGSICKNGKIQLTERKIIKRSVYPKKSPSKFKNLQGSQEVNLERKKFFKNMRHQKHCGFLCDAQVGGYNFPPLLSSVSLLFENSSQHCVGKKNKWRASPKMTKTHAMLPEERRN